MRIRVEPKDIFMYSVFLAFCTESSETEDEAVKAYLATHELIPKRQGKDTVDGQQFDVMYFGGCYLGKHLRVVEDMQRKAVEQEVLSAEIERTLREAEDPATRRAAHDTPEPRWKDLIATLAEEFNQGSAFSADEEGRLKVTLEPALVQQKFIEMAGKGI